MFSPKIEQKWLGRREGEVRFNRKTSTSICIEYFKLYEPPQMLRYPA